MKPHTTFGIVPHSSLHMLGAAITDSMLSGASNNVTTSDEDNTHALDGWRTVAENEWSEAIADLTSYSSPTVLTLKCQPHTPYPTRNNEVRCKGVTHPSSAEVRNNPSREKTADDLKRMEEARIKRERKALKKMNKQ